jgi:hypothetical protein
LLAKKIQANNLRFLLFCNSVVSILSLFTVSHFISFLMIRYTFLLDLARKKVAAQCLVASFGVASLTELQ